MDLADESIDDPRGGTVSLGDGRRPREVGREPERDGSVCAPALSGGHIPLIGEWLALPLVALAGSRRVGDAIFEEIFHPIAERLLARCDAVLRVGGASHGADLMVRVARERGLAVFSSLREVPGCG